MKNLSKIISAASVTTFVLLVASFAYADRGGSLDPNAGRFSADPVCYVGDIIDNGLDQNDVVDNPNNVGDPVAVYLDGQSENAGRQDDIRYDIDPNFDLQSCDCSNYTEVPADLKGEEDFKDSLDFNADTDTADSRIDDNDYYSDPELTDRFADNEVADACKNCSDNGDIFDGNNDRGYYAIVDGPIDNDGNGADSMLIACRFDAQTDNAVIDANFEAMMDVNDISFGGDFDRRDEGVANINRQDLAAFDNTYCNG